MVLTIRGPENEVKKTANNEGSFTNTSLKRRFWHSRVSIFQEHNPREQQGRPVISRSLFHFTSSDRKEEEEEVITLQLQGIEF